MQLCYIGWSISLPSIFSSPYFAQDTTSLPHLLGLWFLLHPSHESSPSGRTLSQITALQLCMDLQIRLSHFMCTGFYIRKMRHLITEVFLKNFIVPCSCPSLQLIAPLPRHNQVKALVTRLEACCQRCFFHFDSRHYSSKRPPQWKKAKISTCDTKSTVKCWSENLPSPPWAFPLYQQDRGEHPAGTMPFLTRTLQSLFRHPGTTHWLVPK